MKRILPLSNGNKSAEDVSQTSNTTCSKRASIIYNPIINLWKICGSYSPKGTQNENLVHLIYCVLVQFIVLAFSVRYLAVFRYESHKIYEIVGILAYIWHYFINTISSIGYLKLNSTYMEGFCESFDSYHKTFGLTCNIRSAYTIICRLAIATPIVSIAYLLCFYIVYLVRRDDVRNLLISSNFTPFENETGITFIIVLVIFSIFAFLFNMVIFSNILFLLVSLHIFKLEFKRLNLKIQEIIKENQLESLEMLRLQHENLIGVLNKGNQIFRYLALTVYLYGIPIACLMLYGATSNRFDIADIIAMVCTLTGAVFGMFLITFMGALLNDAVSIILNLKSYLCLYIKYNHA